MCIGIPMQVDSVDGEGLGLALCHSRSGVQQVRTALVGEVQAGDWLLVFIDSAVERIDARRAAEIDATLSLLEHSLHGGADGAAAAFELPSSMSREAVLALSGTPV